MIFFQILCHGRSSTWSLSNFASTIYTESSEKRFSLNSGAFLFFDNISINSIHLALHFSKL